MEGGELLWVLALHFVLTALPGVAVALGLARRGVASVPVLLAAGMAASGAVGLLAFWAYLADPMVGQTFSFFVVFASIALAGWILFERRVERALLCQLAVPLALWALGTYFLIFLGFLHGGENQPLWTAATRFSVQLPSDNGIPNFFAEWFYRHGHGGTTPVFPGEWLSSDRPPLQIGYVLSQRPFYGGSYELHYQAIGVILQQLWIVGLWALLLAARVGRVTKGLVMITVLLSDLAIVNGFFIWPKMLPAAMLLAAAALVLTPLWAELRRSLWAAALVAALFGLAMMGHGGSVFGIVPLALIAAYRGMPSWRWIGTGVLVGLLFIAPWSAYQKWVDPPGNRLTKYMLAGVAEVDPRGVREAIFDSYGEAGLGGAIHYKAENFTTMVGGGPMVEDIDRAVGDLRDGDLAAFLDEVRVNFFFQLLPSLGLLLIVPIVMALARARGRSRPEEWSFALTCWAVLGIGALAWGLIMFGNLAARAVLHAGSFAIPVFGFCGAVIGLRATYPRFAIYFTMVAAALMLAVYAPALRPLEGTSYSPLAILVAVLALGGFAALALRREGTGEAGLEPFGSPGALTAQARGG
jgi:hypothetical protein